MNTTLVEALDLASSLAGPLQQLASIDAVLCPPSIWLAAVRDVLAGTGLAVGAQNCHFEAKGAFTGEISPVMLADLGCRYVILGHSERRTFFHETDEMVGRKIRAAQSHGLTPIVCVGENLQQNEAGETDAFVGGQVQAALAGLGAAELERLVIAYEPIWAIGTGRAATAQQADLTIGAIRQVVGALFGPGPAAGVRIQYGGSVTAQNAAELFAQPEIDGALVGGASLKAAEFMAICQAAHDTHSA